MQRTTPQGNKIMSKLINNIEYIVPSPDKKIGYLSFNVELAILFSEERKSLSESLDKDIVISPESLALAEQLSESLIKDLEK
jgi:hypothetical protein